MMLPKDWISGSNWHHGHPATFGIRIVKAAFISATDEDVDQAVRRTFHGVGEVSPGVLSQGVCGDDRLRIQGITRIDIAELKAAKFADPFVSREGVERVGGVGRNPI